MPSTSGDGLRSQPDSALKAPNTPKKPSAGAGPRRDRGKRRTNTLLQQAHYGAAILFFLCLTVFSLVLFRRGSVPDADKRRANLIYLICGLVLAGALALMIGYVIYKATLPVEAAMTLAEKPFLFVVETIGVVAFGISWLVKGKTLDVLKAAASLVTG